MPHIHEKIDFTVEVFIVHKNRVLLRLHDKYRIWLSVGGHIELDEDPNQAAIREVKEEVGLDIELVDSRKFKGKNSEYEELIAPVGMDRHRISDTHEHITFIYFAKAKTDKVIPEKETDQWKWCERDEIEKLDNIRPNVIFYAKRALSEVI